MPSSEIKQFRPINFQFTKIIKFTMNACHNLRVFATKSNVTTCKYMILPKPKLPEWSGRNVGKTTLIWKSDDQILMLRLCANSSAASNISTTRSMILG